MKNYTNVCFPLDISTTVTNSICSGTGESSIFLFSTEKRLFISEASIRRYLSQTASLFRLLITVFGSSFRYECLVLLYLNDSVFLLLFVWNRWEGNHGSLFVGDWSKKASWKLIREISCSPVPSSDPYFDGEALRMWEMYK